MGLRYTQPTPIRDRQCPKCGLWFTSRGLNGHLRFKHGTKPRPASQPQLGLRESHEVALAKHVLTGAKLQKRLTGKIGEETRTMLLERVLINLGEQLFGDKTIPVERLHPVIATRLRIDTTKMLEQYADQLEAETEELKKQQGS